MGDREALERRVRRYLNEERQFRYKKTTTTSAGAAAGTTIVSTNLTQLDDWWNGCLATILDGNAEGAERLVEDFTNSTGTLTFTNNAFPIQIASGTTIELTEKGSWSGRTIEQALLDSINFIAALLPKEVLEDYVVTETVGSVNGVADPPTNALDIHHVTINGKPAVPISSKRYRRLISGQDSYLSSTSNTRFLYFFEAKDGSNGQLRFAPAANHSVKYHKVPLLTAFDSSGNTSFPDKFFEPVVYYACSLLWSQAEDTNNAQIWEKKAMEHIQSRGNVISSKFKQG
jgi:hypothetical protein